MSTWRVKDASDALSGLEKVPEQLWDDSFDGIYRMHKSVDYPNPGAQRRRHIVLYDTAFQNEEYLERVIAHELAHHYFNSHSDHKLDYANKTGWKVKATNRGSVFYAPKCCFIKPESAFSIDEDFASNVEFYLYQPETLKRVNPKSYYWISKHFGPNFKIRGRK